MLTPWKKNYDQPRLHIKKQRHYFANKGLSSQSYGLSSGHVWLWELDCEESWAPKNWCFWTVVLKETLESPLDYKEIQPVQPKGDQSWVFIRRTDVEAETPILWPPDAKSWLIVKYPDAGKDWRREKGKTENEMVGWHRWSIVMSLSKLQELVMNQEAWHATVHGVTRSQTRLSNWTELKVLQLEKQSRNLNLSYLCIRNKIPSLKRKVQVGWQNSDKKREFSKCLIITANAPSILKYLLKRYIKRQILQRNGESVYNHVTDSQNSTSMSFQI